MRKGFTLAEVLITLAIIGVVAALVMPGLISDYRKREYVARLQKAVNTWNNSMALMLATDGVDYLNDTEFAKASVGGSFSSASVASQPDAFNILKKYLNISLITQPQGFFPNILAGVQDYIYFWYYTGTPDGTVYDIQIVGLNESPSYLLENKVYNGYVYIDVNGLKGPNKNGRDIFFFYLDVRGNLVPQYSGQSVELGFNHPSTYWINSQGECGVAGSSVLPSWVSGRGCAARIIENGWVMDY